MSLEAAIMGFLAEQPRSGYELKTRCFDRDAGPFWTADQAQIYRTLERLQAAGEVACTRKRQAGRPDRKIYRLTPAGSRALSAWLSAAEQLGPTRDPLLLRMLFSATLDDLQIAENLARWREAHQSRLVELRGEVSSLAAKPGAPTRERLLRAAALDGAIAKERSAIDWLDDTIEAIESGGLPAQITDVAVDRTESA